MRYETKPRFEPDKSKYVRGADGNLVGIDEVSPENRYARGPYKCLSCDHLMVPALGSQRAHHFKHKAERPIDCLRETYLHELAKLTVFSAISDAMKYGSPYYIRRLAPAECDHFKAEFGFDCTSRQLPAQFDLTTQFDRVEMERGAKGYIADVLLSSSRTDDVLAIEIAVTHPCELEKIKSGLSIIEINLRAEDQIDKLRKGIDTTSSGITTHNLMALDVVKQRCVEPCSATVLMFLLYNSGKAWYAEPVLAEVREITSDPRLVTWEFGGVLRAGMQRSEQSVRRSLGDFMFRQKYEFGREVRSCLLCGHNGGRLNQNDIFCAERGSAVWMSSSATGCGTYWPTLDFEEAKALLRKI
jgi:hypothetical protein